MSNDNTVPAAMADQADLMLGKRTLADVQPGGRVRLEDVLPPLPKMQRFTNLYGETYAYSAEQMRDYARAALSAQPSPGGQDALAAELLAHAEGLERMAADDRETGLSIEQAIEDGEGYTPDEATDIAAGLQHDAERGEETAVLLRKAASALAARQPVGSTPEWFELVIRDVCELDPEDPDAAGTVCIRLLDLRLIMERHALPAQAVDLADFKALYRAYVRLLESGRDRIRDLGGACDPVDVMEANDVDLQAARRVIDSQAVGNG